MDLLEQGQGFPVAEERKPEGDDLWKIGKDENGVSAPILNQAFISKLLQEPDKSLNELMY